jgi:tetratricopeptide (TPR) repeat protein
LSHKFPRAGFIGNPLYGSTNRTDFASPRSQILLVARLDGPSPGIAKALVDKAMQAETSGLWGRAYIDARGIEYGDYKLGDDWMKATANILEKNGWTTVMDMNGELFPSGFPMPQIAFYAGWYQVNAAGAFAGEVDFMPGAIAYHLHSYSANTLKNPTRNWVGPFLAKGATATFGCVYEPYLLFTPELPVFFDRLFKGFSLGESFYASLNALSWQAVLVGDPLYRPFATSGASRHQRLAEEKNPLIAWSHLQIVNINIANNLTPAKALIDYLLAQPATQTSALLQEKLGELYEMERDWDSAIQAFRTALTLDPAPGQNLNALLALGANLLEASQAEESYRVYSRIARKHPDYSDIRDIHRKLTDLALQLDRREEAVRWREMAQQTEIDAP